MSIISYNEYIEEVVGNRKQNNEVKKGENHDF